MGNNRSDNCAEKRLWHRIATRFGLIVTVALLTAAKLAAQQTPFAAGPRLQPDNGSEEAAVKRVVDGIMQPYLAQGQRSLPRGRTWSRSPNVGAIVAVSDASAQKYMPEGYTLQAQQLTPLELADFTSGMPDDPTNLPRLLERRSIDYYTVNDFLTWGSRYEPTSQLPAPYRYSNAGIGLLSYLVATATGKNWEDQVNSEILQPLGMADTTLRPTPEQQKRLAQGHNRAGQDAPRWPVFAWYAAGGLRSTAQDMISFGEAYLGHKEVNGKTASAELIEAMQLAQKPIFTMPNGNKQAMAWVNNIGGGNPNLHPVIMKNGGTAGFGTGIAINPTKDAAIFIGMNQAGAQPIAKGVEILRHLP